MVMVQAPKVAFHYRSYQPYVILHEGVLNVENDEAEPCVVYSTAGPDENGGCPKFVQSAKRFFGTVEHEGKVVPRFEIYDLEELLVSMKAFMDEQGIPLTFLNKCDLRGPDSIATLSIEGCSACKGNHKGVKAYKLKSEELGCTHICLCPDTKIEIFIGLKADS